MHEVFTLTVKESTNGPEQFIYSSQNIYEILDKMFQLDYEQVRNFNIYVTAYEGNSIHIKNGEISKSNKQYF